MMFRRLTITVAGFALASVACSSNGSMPVESTAANQPSITAGSTAPPSTNAAVTTAVTPPVDSQATTTSSPPGPLPEPVVALYEIGPFDQPVEVAVRPDDARLFVVEQAGRIVAVTDESTDTVLDITDLTDAAGEQGLLGLAFHPTADFGYVNFTDTDGDTVVAEFAIDATTGEFHRDSLREVLTVDQPYANHNGGKLAFGPDGLLYIGLGDGGAGGDPERRGLDLSTRLGKILRIDPLATGGEPFTVPADNPFADVPGADPTIWSYGLRNPWRFTFDTATGDLWIADVGQGDFEEINHLVATEGLDAAKGVNFGWSAFEGFERFNDDQPVDDAVPPLFVYDHDGGRCSVSGGAVARGDAVPDLRGWYVFGDFCSGEIWALDTTAPTDEPRVIDIAELGGLASVAEGPDGDIYVVSTGGTVARLIPG